MRTSQLNFSSANIAGRNARKNLVPGDTCFVAADGITYELLRLPNVSENWAPLGDGSGGEPGNGITSVDLVGDNLVVTYSDSTTQDVGRVVYPGADGADGADGINGTDGRGITAAEINLDGELVITYSDASQDNLGVVVGADGAAGANGTNGLSVLPLLTAPTPSDGVDGQVAIDTAAGVLYGAKTAGTWPAGVSLIGPAGPAGAGVVADTSSPAKIPLGRTDAFRTMAGNGTAPTFTPAASALTITQTVVNQFAGLSVPIRLLANKTVIVQGQCSVGAASGSGLFVGVNPGSYGTLDTATATMLTWRLNGSVTAYRADNTVNGSWGVSPTPSLGQTAWVSGDIVKMVLVFGANPATATMRLFKNGMPTAQTFTVTWGTDGSLFAGWRCGTNPQTATVTRLEVLDNYIPATVFVDAAAASGGDGSAATPFNNLIIATAEAEATGATSLRMNIRGGTYSEQYIALTNRWRDVQLFVPPGERAIVKGSATITSGWSATAGAPGVYERPLPGTLDTGCNIIYPSRADGVRPFTICEKVSTGTAPSALLEGQTVTSSGANRLYFKPFDGTDPNTLTLELAYIDNCITLGGGTDTFNVTNVRAERIEALYPYASGWETTRCILDLRDCYARGASVTSGFRFLDSAGRAELCTAFGSWNDGFAGYTSGATLPYAPKVALYGCNGIGMKVGDGLSMHQTVECDVFGGEYSDNGKHGIVLIGSGRVEGAIARRNADSNFILAGTAPNPAANAEYPPVGTTVTARFINCHGEDPGSGANFSNITSPNTGQGIQIMEIVGGSAKGGTTIRSYQPNGAGRAGEIVTRVRSTAAHDTVILSESGNIIDIDRPIFIQSL